MTIVRKKYSQNEIIKDITDYIINHHLPVDTKLSSTREMALRYNVSDMTVNRAINKLVGEGVVYRTRGSGTYVGNVFPGRSKVKVKIFNWQYSKDDPLAIGAYGTYYDALVEGLEKFGFDVCTSEKRPFLDKIFSGEKIERFDLLIVPGGMVDNHSVTLLKKLRIPVILINDEKLSPYPFHQVFHDYVPGFQKALEHIKKLGFNNFYIAGMTGSTPENRLRILQQCAKEARIHYDVLPLMQHSYSHHPQRAFINGQEHGKYCLEHHLEGVVFALSDFIAFGMLDIVGGHNVGGNNKLKIISYDNLEGRAVHAGEPVLTSITHPLEQLASQTVSLVDYIVSRKFKYGESNFIVRVPASELVIRSSA